MTFVFWQNILSIHQSAFISALSKSHNVLLIVEKEYDSIRQESGWIRPEFGASQIIIAPSQSDVESLLLKYEDAIHVLSGLEVTFKQFNLTQKLADEKHNVICYLEPFNTGGIKKYFREVKYRHLCLKYSRKLLAMLPTGKMGVKQYQSLGFRNIFEWGYFTEFTDVRSSKKKNVDKPNLLFVGSLDERKNILFLLDAMTSRQLHDFELSIIGNGPLRSVVEDKVGRMINIHYLGTKNNNEVKRLMSQHDILVLPSKFDGWGAVVNEALIAGMRVVCSDCCGASSLLNESWRGSVFQNGNMENFIEVMTEQLDNGISTDSDRIRIISWCNTHISGAVAADYFNQICSYILGERNLRPIVPWEI